MRNKFELYISRCHAREERKLLLKKAMLSYGIDSECFSRAQILRTAMGKPYFENLNIHFNISHSQDIWACLIGPGCCGLDVQYIKPCNFGKIAGRFFSCAENEYVRHHGLVGFFDIWARKEAYGKYTGEGFFGKYEDFVDDEGKLKEQVNDAAFKEVKLPGMADDYICLCCLPNNFSDETIEIRKG